MIISRLILSRMGNIWDRICRESQNTNFVFNKFLYLKNRAVYEIMWKNVVRVRQATDDNKIRRMRIACWITKVTDKHSECVILIALPRQQWLREYASKLRYTYIACHVRKLKKQFRPKCCLPNLPNCMASHHRCYNFVFRHRESLNCNTLRWQIHKPLIRLYLWSKEKECLLWSPHFFVRDQLSATEAFVGFLCYLVREFSQKFVTQIWSSWKLTRWQSYFIWGCKWIFTPTFRIYLPIWVKFGIEFPYITKASNTSFMKIGAAKDVLNYCTCHIYWLIWVIFVTRNLSICEFRTYRRRRKCRYIRLVH